MGGKWTTCRPMAEDTLAAVECQIGRTLPTPEPMPLRGAAANPDNTISELQQQALALEDLLPHTPERAQQILHLQHNFGLHAEAVVAQAPMEAREPLSSVIPICRAEIQHAICKEHASCADDVLSRRCRLAMVDAAEAERLSPLVNNELERM